MATSQLWPVSKTTSDNLRGPSNTTATPPYHAVHALENCRHWTVCAETKAAAPQDSFATYKTYADTNASLVGENCYLKPGDGNYKCQSGAAAAHSGSIDDCQPEARGHTAAYRPAARLANHSAGSPLATIIEQGSYSTLNSHPSLLSVGRFPSIKTAEHSSPNRGPRWRSRSLDENVLHDIQEDLARELDTSTLVVPRERLDGDDGSANPASCAVIPLTSHRFELQRSPSPHPSGEILGQDRRGVKDFIRGVVQNVRGVPKTGSRSSSLRRAPIMDRRESAPSFCDSSPWINQQDQSPALLHLPAYSSDNSTRVPGNVAVAPTCMHQTTDRVTSSSSTYPSAHTLWPFTIPCSDVTESAGMCNSLNSASTSQSATRSHERPFSMPFAHAATRDVAQKHGMIQAPTSHHDRFDTSARYTFDGVPVYREPPPSMREASSARETFASQNASFCSTVTSSYSGTVIGVDVDLQPEFSHRVRRSQSPPEPVWFTPQMAELERQASLEDSCQHREAVSPSHAVSHSITSSALTFLLPIAAASGIVRANYDTPKISFYSPSGNLIRPEDSSPQDTNSPDREYSPVIASSYYNRQSAKSMDSSGGQTIRPRLIPMTTPPTHKSPLPLHMRHHHNYRRPEVSQTSSFNSSMNPEDTVKGCDGVIRENSLTPRSGVFFPHGKDRANRSVKLAVHDMKAEARFYKARFRTLAVGHSFVPSIPKDRTLQKRHVHDCYANARETHSPSGESRKGGYRQDVLGPLAGHILRICFCQPYDDAGKPTRATAAGACMAGDGLSQKVNTNSDRHTKDAERLLPNARVVNSGRSSEGREAKRVARRKTD